MDASLIDSLLLLQLSAMLLRSSNFQFSIPRRQPHSRKDIDLLWVRCVRDKKLVQPHSRAIGVSAARGTTYKTTAGIESAPAATQLEEPQHPILGALLPAILQPYFQRNPKVQAAANHITKAEGGPVHYDHIAFRSFGVDGCGMASMAAVFLDLGYVPCGQLDFEAKKLKALWFAPPPTHPPLPRIFISELIVDQLSAVAQATIRKYTRVAAPLGAHAALSSVLGAMPWPLPSLHDYRLLARESEYASWTLVNGYALNHAAVAVHSLRGEMSDIRHLNARLEEEGVELRGGLKVSPDGGLLQSSTVADKVAFAFEGGEEGTVSASYLEFTQRLVLPEFSHLATHEIREHHRRDGFEVGNADKIFESTYSNSNDRVEAER